MPIRAIEYFYDGIGINARLTMAASQVVAAIARTPGISLAAAVRRNKASIALRGPTAPALGCAAACVNALIIEAVAAT